MRKKIHTFLNSSLFRYLIIGGFTFTIDYGLTTVAHELLGLNTFISSLIGTGTALVFNYNMSNLWTFKAKHRRHLIKVPKYGVMVLINYSFANLGFEFLVYRGVSFFVAKIFLTCAVTIWSFLAYRFWVFK